jgi:hypothetical protein
MRRRLPQMRRIVPKYGFDVNGRFQLKSDCCRAAPLVPSSSSGSNYHQSKIEKENIEETRNAELLQSLNGLQRGVFRPNPRKVSIRDFRLEK